MSHNIDAVVSVVNLPDFQKFIVQFNCRIPNELPKSLIYTWNFFLD